MGTGQSARVARSGGERVLVGTYVRELVLGASREIEGAASRARESGASDVYDPELTRLLRVSLRRVRYQLAALSAVEPALKTRGVRRRLAEISEPFGALRDAQVLEDAVRDVLGGRRRRGAGKKILKRARRERERRERPVRRALDAGASITALTVLDDYRRGLPFQIWLLGDAEPLARKALAATWRDLTRAAQRAKERPSDRRLHELRIEAKRAMYVARGFSELLGPRVEVLAERLSDLQSTLGRQHDHVNVAGWLRRLGRERGGLRRGAGRLAREESRRAAKEARRWRALWKAAVKAAARAL